MRLTGPLPRIRCSFRPARRGRLRARDVSRSGPARAQVRELRQGYQRHLGLPMVPHLGSTTAPRSSSPAPVGQSPAASSRRWTGDRNGASRDADGALDSDDVALSRGRDSVSTFSSTARSIERIVSAIDPHRASTSSKRPGLGAMTAPLLERVRAPPRRGARWDLSGRPARALSRRPPDGAPGRCAALRLCDSALRP